ncbi:unnamed protein product [Brassicogethes aeneus]|uniref:Uncharacterized protein n=1 Tax=Brassicogethes aeneus TaxID=1431903 RepID=A0A9P0AU28_BRAAE|nr:unnamed protein product [Brassicogethes aeneus]
MSLPKIFYMCILVLDLVYFCKAELSGNNTFFRPGMVEYVKSKGYPIEEYDVTTEDGYILKIHRIPFGKYSKERSKRPPVILMHGLMGCSENFVYLGEKKSLSFMAAEAGYDVWLPNARGNTHSRRHVTLNPESDQIFWDFSWHEIGKYDIPRVIDLIVEKTGQDKIPYVGHSQGGTVMLVMASERPEYKAKISKYIGLSPVVLFNHLTHPWLKELMEHAKSVYDVKLLVNQREKLLWADYNDMRLFIYALGQRYPELLKGFFFRLLGESEEINWKQFTKFAGTIPAGAANKQIMHYAQTYKLRSFRFFDYGPKENLVRYNSTIPPLYKLKNMDVPSYIFGGQNDVFANLEKPRIFTLNTKAESSYSHSVRCRAIKMVSLKNLVNFIVILVLVKNVASDKSEPFSKPDMVEYVTSFGYPIETYMVETEDGYILKIFRIPHGKKFKKASKKPPIILMHGVLAGAESYVMLGPTRSLAFKAAEAGYDVWLPNCRGTTHSRKHKTLDPDGNPSFWDFSWHEIGKYDLPAIVDKVMEKSGFQQVTYIGHSQGGTVVFVMASERPEYKKKLSKVIAMAPAVYLNHFKHPYLKDLLINFKSYYEGFTLVNSGENLFYTNYNDLRYFIYAFKDLFPDAVHTLWNSFNGESEVTDWQQVLEFFGTLPAGSSVKQIAHFAQSFNSKSFRQFDYGAKKNLKKYNSASPPKYNVKGMDLPTYIFASKSDVFVDIKDMEDLRDTLPNVKQYHVVPVNKFAHMDFTCAKNLDVLVVNKILKILGNVTNNKTSYF